MFKNAILTKQFHFIHKGTFKKSHTILYNSAKGGMKLAFPCIIDDPEN